MEYIGEKMEENSKELEKTIGCMEEEFLDDLMVGLIMENIRLIRKKGMENLDDQMGKCIRAIGKMENSMEKDFIEMHMEMKK